jgi:hypothetical protein
MNSIGAANEKGTPADGLDHITERTDTPAPG